MALCEAPPIHERGSKEDARVTFTFATSRHGVESIPKFRMADDGLPADAAAQIVRDERQLDSNPRFNLATFLTTWIKPQARVLTAREVMAEALDVNAVELEEYPSIISMQRRCVGIISDLFNLPDGCSPAGTATIGSTEAVMLALLAMKARWQRRRAEQGKPADKPNLVVGHNCQVAVEKFCRYFEVEPNFVPLSETCFVTTPEGAAKACNENTIGVLLTLGSTYTGEFEDVPGVAAALREVNTANPDWSLRIHVDAASGGFVAPFTVPDLKWDFREPLMESVNVSGHKYGLVLPGIGWVVFRGKASVPEDLVLHTHYLGGDQPNFNVNFSKPPGVHPD